MKNQPIAPDITVVISVKKPGITNAAIQSLILRAAAVVKLNHAFAVNVQIVGVARSRALNKKWRGKDTPTNVLSFAAREGDMPTIKTSVEDLGDIVMCPRVAAKEAPDFGVSVREHLSRLVVHGFLHLVGHDHEQDADAATMEALEWKIVRSA